MNKLVFDVLLYLFKNSYSNQRDLAKAHKCSLGAINKAIIFLSNNGFLNNNYSLTDFAVDYIKDNSPQSAIILAAGKGTRMLPISDECAKALVLINNKPLIEYQIEYLKSVGINEIYIVVGFHKEDFDYLIDKYDVQLIVNMEYSTKNNLISLYNAKSKICNSYIIPSDIWCNQNPFSKIEAYSWYLMSAEKSNKSVYRINNKGEIIKTSGYGNNPIGISYITKQDSRYFVERLEELFSKEDYQNLFWEEACFFNNKMFQFAKVVDNNYYVEINTYSELRSLDSQSDSLKSPAIEIIKSVLSCSYDDIKDIKAIKKGMTNQSFVFSCKGKKYIMRIPGKGTDLLINRANEAHTYGIINKYGICDNTLYVNPENGYKISEYLECVRTCDAFNNDDLSCAMSLLKRFHSLDIKVPYIFDLFEKIEFYQSLMKDKSSVFSDYNQTKENIYSLKSYIDSYKQEYSLTHIDAIADNFLFCKDENNNDDLKLIDWEYSAMQDPHVDLAMFSVYSSYDKSQIDNLIDIYFEGKCQTETRILIYCYVAVCGLLWSNWCEYKRTFGIEFGEYSLIQYRFAKDFYKIAINEIKKL